MTTSPDSLALLHRAADLRAHGSAWADTARQLAVEPDHLRQLATDHRRDYDKLARRARTEAARETFDAALAALRNLLKSEDPKVTLLAATTIVRYEMTRLRRGERVARERLERDSRRAPVRCDTPFELPELNVSELTEVAEEEELVAAKNVAQTVVPPKPAVPRVVIDEAARKRERLLTAAMRNGARSPDAGPPLGSWLPR